MNYIQIQEYREVIRGNILRKRGIIRNFRINMRKQVFKETKTDKY